MKKWDFSELQTILWFFHSHTCSNYEVIWETVITAIYRQILTFLPLKLEKLTTQNKKITEKSVILRKDLY